MANEDVKFARGLSSAIPVEKVPGRFLFETDTGVLYLDVNSTNRTPVVDPRVSTLIERLSDEFQGTKLASDEGVNQNLGASFKVINISSGSIQDLPNFYTEGEDPQPTYALMMVSKVRQGLTDSLYIQTLYCDTGSIYSRQVSYYSGNYSGDPWIKIGPNSVDTSDFATKEELDDYLPLTGGTLTGALRVTTLGPTTGSNNLTLSTSGSNVRIRNVATPTNNTDAANKSYVDGLINPNAGNLTNKTTTASSKTGTYTWVYPDKAVSGSSVGVGYFSIGFNNRSITASSHKVTDTITIPAECLPTGICMWMAFIIDASARSGGSAVDSITTVTPNFGYILGNGTRDTSIKVEFDISSISNATGGQIGVLVMGTGDLGLGI